jgi:hypothetical protein
MELYSFPAVLDITQRIEGRPSEEENRESLTVLNESARQSAENARRLAQAASDSAADADEAAFRAEKAAGKLDVHDTSPDAHEDIRGAMVGKKTPDGGEIFNDYENNKASKGAIAINQNCKALGKNSFAGGNNATAANENAFAHGPNAYAGGNNSVALGNGVSTSAPNQIAVGKHNAKNPNARFMVGNGESNEKRKNAFEVLNDGSAVIDAQGNNEKSVVQKQYVDRLVDLAKNALNFKGTTQGKGSVSIGDVSPIPHTAKITVKDEGNICPYKDCTLESAVKDSHLKANNTYTLSFESETDITECVICTLGGEQAQYSNRDGLQRTANGRYYIIFTTDDYVAEISAMSSPILPPRLDIKSVCIVEGTGTEYIPYRETDFIPVTISVTSDGATNTVYFEESGTKAVEITATSGEVTIAADNPDTNIEVEYNRDIIKAITDLENTVGLVNATLASLVDVEE